MMRTNHGNVPILKEARIEPLIRDVIRDSP